MADSAQVPCSCGCGGLGPKPLPLAQAALDLDQAERTLRRWVADGAPHHKGKGRTGALTFDGAELRAWMARTQRTGELGPRTATERALAEATPAAPPAPPPASPEVEKASREVAQVEAELDEEGSKLLQALASDDRAALLRLAPKANPLLVKKIEAVARARVSLAEAVKRELDNQQRRRELLVAVDVVGLASQAVDVVKSGLEALPGKLTPRLVGQDYDSIYGALEDELRALSSAFADAFSRLG